MNINIREMGGNHDGGQKLLVQAQNNERTLALNLPLNDVPGSDLICVNCVTWQDVRLKHGLNLLAVFIQIPEKVQCLPPRHLHGPFHPNPAGRVR